MEHLTLFELNNLISDTLQSNLEASYWVMAEISEVRVHQKGHCYLELVEKEDEVIKARLRGTIWSYTYRNLSVWFRKMTGDDLRPGLKILFNAKIQFHEVFGLSLNIKDIDANFTLGERARRRLEIIEKLKEDGVFEMNKDLSLPAVPQRIAIISSESAAGYGDFMDQTSQNSYGYKLHTTLFPSTMQGTEAVSSIINSMHQVFERMHQFDVMIIIRGGGASVDLDCFDSYELASHVAQMPIPVITGIGHERDETVCDLVAHTKMKTPTAVSEFLISGIRSFEEEMEIWGDKLLHGMREKLNQQDMLLERKTNNLRLLAEKNTAQQHRKLDGWLHHIRLASQNKLTHENKVLQEYRKKIQAKPLTIIEKEQASLSMLQKYFAAHEPENILKKGYTISKVNGRPIQDASQISGGDELETIGFRMTLKSTIHQIETNKNQ